MTDSATDPRPPGRLFVVGTPIGNLGDLGPRAGELLASADLVAAEDTRRTRGLLSHLGVRGPRMLSVRAHNERQAARVVIDRLLDGLDVVYVTDAGMPTISDPGGRLVAAVVDARLAVTVVPGPDAVTAALAVSLFDGRRFGFDGFWPRKGRVRRERLEEVRTATIPTVVFEAPHRLVATMADLEAVVGPDRPICVANDLTKRFERVHRGSVAEVRRAVGTSPKGEYVLVIGGVDDIPDPEPATDR